MRSSGRSHPGLLCINDYGPGFGRGQEIIPACPLHLCPICAQNPSGISNSIEIQNTPENGLSTEEFNEFVDREGAKYRADPRLRRITKIAAMKRTRKIVILALEQIDPERARMLKSEFPESVESRGPEQERDLEDEEASTRRLPGIVADLNTELVKASVRTARRITGLFDPSGSKSSHKRP